MQHTRFLLLFFPVLILITGCNSPRKDRVDDQPLEGLPLEELVGKARNYPLEEVSPLNYLAENPRRERVAPKVAPHPDDIPCEILLGQELCDADELYPILRIEPAYPGGFLVEFTRYFEWDYSDVQPAAGGGELEISDMVVDLTLMDSTENIIFRDPDDMGDFRGSDSAYYLHYQTFVPYTQLRNFNSGLQPLTLNIQGYGHNRYGQKSRDKLVEYTVSFTHELPKLVHSQLQYNGLRLTDEAYDRSWDEFLANPRPDIYWYLEINGYDEYRSAKIRNTQVHDDEATIDFYHFSLDDDVKIVVMDGDVFLNADDVIAFWSGKVKDLDQAGEQELEMQDLEYFKLEFTHFGEMKKEGTP